MTFINGMMMMHAWHGMVSAPPPTLPLTAVATSMRNMLRHVSYTTRVVGKRPVQVTRWCPYRR